MVSAATRTKPMAASSSRDSSGSRSASAGAGGRGADGPAGGSVRVVTEVLSGAAQTGAPRLRDSGRTARTGATGPLGGRWSARGGAVPGPGRCSSGRAAALVGRRRSDDPCWYTPAQGLSACARVRSTEVPAPQGAPTGGEAHEQPDHPVRNLDRDDVRPRRRRARPRGRRARRFAAGVRRRPPGPHPSRLDDLLASLRADGTEARAYAVDVRDRAALSQALQAAGHDLGPVEVLQYSPKPAPEFLRPVLETGADDLVGPVETSVYGPAAAVGQVLPGMRALGRGSVLFVNGASAVRPGPRGRRHVGRVRGSERVRAAAARRPLPGQCARGPAGGPARHRRRRPRPRAGRPGRHVVAHARRARRPARLRGPARRPRRHCCPGPTVTRRPGLLALAVLTLSACSTGGRASGSPVSGPATEGTSSSSTSLRRGQPRYRPPPHRRAPRPASTDHRHVSHRSPARRRRPRRRHRGQRRAGRLRHGTVAAGAAAAGAVFPRPRGAGEDRGPARPAVPGRARPAATPRR